MTTNTVIFNRLRHMVARTPEKDISLDLHIGMPKTGTTAIQNYLAFNRDKLREQCKILYPVCGVPVNQHTALVKSIAAKKFPWAHFNAAIDQFEPQEYLADVLNICRQHKCRKVILSSEYFWASPVMQAGLPYHYDNQQNFSFIEDIVKSCRELLSSFASIRIIVYLRRQDDWFDSFFNQQLKDGFPIPEQDEIAIPKNYLMYGRIIDLWKKYFGKDNVVVRCYEDLKEGNVVKDFCQIAQIDHRKLNTPPKNKDSANTKLSPTSTKIMRCAIEQKLDQEVISLLKEVLQEISFAQKQAGQIAPRTIFDESFYDAVRLTYHGDYANFQLQSPQPTERDGTIANQLDQPKAPLFPESNVEKVLYELLKRNLV